MTDIQDKHTIVGLGGVKVKCEAVKTQRRVQGPSGEHTCSLFLYINIHIFTQSCRSVSDGRLEPS